MQPDLDIGRPPFGKVLQRTLRWRELGVLPLLVMLPFMYYPKLLEGDTQPWVLMAALLALVSFRVARFARRSDFLPILLALACALTYVTRSDSAYDMLRAVYTQLAFVVFWLVCRRENDEFFPAAVRLTITIWLAVGLYQYIAVAMGWPVEFSGRYVEGRSGVPSLTSEPSTYGSLSMLQMMYLLSRDERKNNVYVLAAAVSVVLSGSVLAMVLLVFPLVKLKARLQLIALVVLPALVGADYLFREAGLTSRLLSIGAEGSDLAAVLLDPSLNLRAGHIWFTLVENFGKSMLMQTPPQFMLEYNAFAQSTGVLNDTESNFILSAAGELIYGAGPFGLLLILTVLYQAQRASTGAVAKVEKVLFITMCMLNPISLSNFFLVLYANRRA
jgi:hypothetical protein